MPPLTPVLKPRKTPVQARSVATVDAIMEATIQVLGTDGIKDLTTTKVAERAGVSVGSLYQYFPNKESLLDGVLERYLDGVTDTLERTCASLHGESISIMGRTLAMAYVDCKLARPEPSRALYAVATELGSATIVRKMCKRGDIAIRAMLETATDATFDDIDTVTTVLQGVMSGPLQRVLGYGSKLKVKPLREQMALAAVAYLEAAASR